MRQRWLILSLLGLMGCTMTPVPTTGARPAVSLHGHDGEVYTGGSTYRVLATEELPVVGVAVDSQASGFGQARLVDGDRATQWSNGGYRNPTSWAAIELAAGADLAAVSIKTGPTAPGASYDIEVSDDGLSWRLALANQTNTTWNMEAKALPAGTAGRFVRVFWRNSPSNPQAHFMIYELAVTGAPQAITPPSPDPLPTDPPSPSDAPESPVPSAPPSPEPSPSPAAPVTAGPTQRLTPAAVTADSSYAGLHVGRAVDGDAATQWANGGYRAPEAWVVLDWGLSCRVDRVSLKTGALSAGVTYVLEVSDDGATWTALTGPLTNTTWGLESRTVAGQGRYLRVRFANNLAAPTARFYLYELAVDGAPLQAAPSATPATPSAAPSVPVESPSPSIAPEATPSPEPTATASPTPAPLPPGGPAPMRRVSVPGVAIASSGNATAAADGDPGTHWSPSGAQPQWLAVPLERPTTGRLVAVWDTTGYTFQNTGAAPRDYGLQVSADSTDGRNGTWYELKTVTANPVRSRADAFEATDARWVRMAVRSVWSFGPQLRRLEVHAAEPANRLDSWLILGDSITAGAFDPARPNAFPATVAHLAPGYHPLLVGGGTGGDTAANGLTRLAAALPDCPPGGYVGLAYGTNDATRGVPVATFKSQLERMARDILASGRTPVLARVPYNRNGNLASYVRAIDELTSALRLPNGPDLYSWFLAHPEEMGSDTVHPNAQGQASIQRLWGEAAAGAYRQP
jgi:lysophospholipase L1-like esterase